MPRDCRDLNVLEFFTKQLHGNTSGKLSWAKMSAFTCCNYKHLFFFIILNLFFCYFSISFLFFSVFFFFYLSIFFFSFLLRLGIDSRISKVLNDVQLEAPYDRIIKSFSGGQQARLLLAAGRSHSFIYLFICFLFIIYSFTNLFIY